MKNDAVAGRRQAAFALIPLFDGEKQQKTAVPALRRLNLTLQVIDFISAYANSATPRNRGIFSADQGNYNGRTAECSGIGFQPLSRARREAVTSQTCNEIAGRGNGMMVSDGVAEVDFGD